VSSADGFTQPPARIDPLTGTSLYLKLQFGETLVSNATGFVVEYRGRNFLVSNWHVFAGRNADTGELLSPKTGAIPNQVRIAHHHKKQLGMWQMVGESLYNEDGAPRWVTHPFGPRVDVAVLELRKIKDWMVLRPFDLALENVDIQVYPGMPIQVIGFPLGLRENIFFPIWKTGHLASDYDLYHKGLPAFLIDATTRAGMSGSPVVARTFGSHVTRNGGMIIGGGTMTRFLGVYAGRVHEDAEVGRVWRPSALREVLEHAIGQHGAAQ
jgi:hypothetical protein